ncbi:FeoA family protein [Cellulomonas sp. S1-8]|uniref:FeoA family protein n=1 Tax=Cellulomonas sp. S1-8 TaxID=2904790 RepID=UPI0022442FCD|nr:FeoA family protein [Cellulomonas sp. S1-8]UZN03994.1 ferrous iron transport protein A [Cellulomonas sp. S1-8]
MELSGVPTGGSARVVAIDLDDGPRVRLRELGLRPGGDLRVTHRGAFGGLVVAVGADRFAVDARTASHVRVDVGPGTPPATGTTGATS